MIVKHGVDRVGRQHFPPAAITAMVGPMCGICGIVAEAPARPAELQASLQQMAAALAHRGPDGDGFWLDEAAGAALGHRRLAIIDLSPGGRQPMLSADGRYALTYNGEIYNYRALRSELEATGVRFRSQSDTEVLLEACARWGIEAAAKRLVGIFALALWDRLGRRLFLLRDQLGVKPVYWAQLPSAFVFGSELRALSAHPAWRPEIDRDALVAYFRHGYVPAPRTIYRDVFKLPPASLLVLEPGKAPRIARYWDARAIAMDGLRMPLALGDAEAADRLEALLGDAVERQMVSDVPLGAFLSGGIDSSTVVALMQSRSARPIKTFTIGFHEDAYDEARYARAVAKHLGTNHTELYVTPERARGLVPGIAEWFDEPFADSSQLPTFLVAQLARRQVTVALSGDGGDEAFAGYNRYAFADTWWRHFSRMPPALQTAAAGAIRSLSPMTWDRLFAAMPAAWRPRLVGDKLHKFAGLLRLRSESAVYRRLVSQWDEPGAIVPGAAEPPSLLTDESIVRDLPNFIARLQLLDALTYLPDDILTKVDRATMAVSLETRVPLLDPGVIDFAWHLPLRQRMRRGQGKWLLCQVLHRYVPAALVERPKMGFGVPIDGWLRGPLRDWAEDLLSERRLREDGLLDAPTVRRTWSEHLSGHRNWQHALWCALMFQEWKARWFDRPTSTPLDAPLAARG